MLAVVHITSSGRCPLSPERSASGKSVVPNGAGWPPGRLVSLITE